ncbi:hypothetical protein CYFUS_002667 [Cystobacter fuscus]|uniref:Uncharacterized protein n=1 Tax=Cystobacter fuscus TaxID=43 RepID=A0A250J271_9BACT|nr:hypothetical protein [Cystobacter fuscus]ATB37246.1 hypothetical protein CYFUS_002667 [Cystobacter fuscus]
MARFVWETEPERVQRLWHTYVKRGAFVPEMSRFGQSCPEPDFERLRHPKSSAPVRTWRLRTLAMVGGGILLPLAGAFFFVRRRRRQAKRQEGGQ